MNRRSFLAALVAVPVATALPFEPPMFEPVSIRRHSYIMGEALRFHPDAFAMTRRPLEIGDGWAQQHACGLKAGDVVMLDGKLVTLG